ncbi:hypothetical protein AGABI2DRAFT_119219 [Agaricus bisporus var. bisporus H97]|uniref:hypothetical protein n=1 Tax=Agaricus bisporus var. bisporus (strain H97 / ATCC MYA-4626 / FGSC 10389) TaxID=936046 RepID=UPI00029F7E6A|nr:hypothetical protein AGABI2DRAFT_119219 [Agaricus bisporus var. bisporus H97]EKV45534.1 hypothetical protein AGABI2DRAFT_119219 [Agaricus bisporus var. bisporus H97]
MPAYRILPAPPTTGDIFKDMLLTEAWRNALYLHAYDANGNYVSTYETDPTDGWHNRWKTYLSPRLEMRLDESNYWTNDGNDQSWITPWDLDWPQSATFFLSKGMNQSNFYKFENPNLF